MEASSGNLAQEIESFRNTIKKAHKDADVKILKETEQRFNELKFRPEEWKSFAYQHNIVKWPSQQNERQSVGGWLFYPEEFNRTEISSQQVAPWGLKDSKYTRYLTWRIDYIFSLAIASKFENPVAQYDLCQTMLKALDLKELFSTEIFEVYAPPSLVSIGKLYKKSFIDLESATSYSEEAKEIIGSHLLSKYTLLQVSHFFDSIDPGPSCASRKNIEESLQVLSTSKSLKSRFTELEVRRVFQPNLLPPIEDYLSVAKAGYAPAYVSIALNFWYIKVTEKKEYLLEAIKLNFLPAYIVLGDLCISQGERQKNPNEINIGLKQFEIAFEKGISHGYISRGLAELGVNPSIPPFSVIKSLPSSKEMFLKKICKAKSFFEEAGKKFNDSKGYYLSARVAYAACLFFTIKGDDNESLKYRKDIEKLLQKAAVLGSTEAYCEIEIRFDKEVFKEIKEKLGAPLYDGLWEELMDYLID